MIPPHRIRVTDQLVRAQILVRIETFRTQLALVLPLMQVPLLVHAQIVLRDEPLAAEAADVRAVALVVHLVPQQVRAVAELVAALVAAERLHVLRVGTVVADGVRDQFFARGEHFPAHLARELAQTLAFDGRLLGGFVQPALLALQLVRQVLRHVGVAVFRAGVAVRRIAAVVAPLVVGFERFFGR